jgi:hypothetical protein
MRKVVKEERTAQEIATLREDIQRRLDKRRKKLGFALKVIGDPFQEAEWTYFVVQPRGRGVRAYDYAHALTQVEDEMREAGMDRHILLVPVLPG